MQSVGRDVSPSTAFTVAILIFLYRIASHHILFFHSWHFFCSHLCCLLNPKRLIYLIVSQQEIVFIRCLWLNARFKQAKHSATNNLSVYNLELDDKIKKRKFCMFENLKYVNDSEESGFDVSHSISHAYTITHRKVGSENGIKSFGSFKDPCNF